MAHYSGGCHCGAIRFEVDEELRDLEVCNCSICGMTAYVHWSVSPERFRLLTPDSAFETYRFGTRVAEHRFCRTCGSARATRTRRAVASLMSVASSRKRCCNSSTSARGR